MFHWVDQGHARGTLQLGQPAWIAEATGLPVISDVRAADVAAGGEGAPLVPVLDRMLLEPYRAAGVRAGALNLGGIANITVCAPGAEPVAWDIGPANALIDAVVTAAAFHAGHLRPRRRPGRVRHRDPGAADRTARRALLRGCRRPRARARNCSTSATCVRPSAGPGSAADLPDLVATLTELTAVTVAGAVSGAGVQVLVAAGGGVRNPVLMRRITQLLPGVEVLTTDRLGVPSDVKEAVAFALIGWATAHGLPGNVPSCTGAAGPRVLGRISPAPDGRLPQAGRLAAWPAALSSPGTPASPGDTR